MSVREYIGARYIPVFANPSQWDITSQYEPLTVVTNQGASYVSRRYVPEGIQLNNTDYWVLWADYNAQLQHYIDEVTTFDGRIDALEDALPIADFSSLNTVSDKFPIITSNIADGAVTTAKIADGAVTLDKVDADIINAIPSVLTSTYLGDFIINMQHGCCFHNNGRVYSFCSNGYDQNGECRVFNISTNIKEASYTIPVGHANSCAYDPGNGHIYLAPMAYYNAGVTSDVTYIYDFASLNAVPTEINFPERIFSVSYDHVTSKLYAFGADDLNYMNIYRREGGSFALWSKIPLEEISSSVNDINWQDCAVYDDILYFVKPEGSMYIGKLKETTTHIIKTATVSWLDASGNLKYGEVEGIEFDETGLMYMARNYNFSTVERGEHHPVNDAFVTTVNINGQIIPNTLYKMNPHGTYHYVSNPTNTFALSRGEIRSLSQISLFVEKPGQVEIPQNETVTENWRVRITDVSSLFFTISGSFSCKDIAFDGGNIGLIITSTGSITTTSDNLFTCGSRMAVFSIREQGTITFPSDGNTHKIIAYGTSPCIAFIQALSSYPQNINDIAVYSPGVLCGNARIAGTGQ